MGKGCSKAVIDLCRASSSFPFLCRSLHYFARASRSVDAEAYCNASFDRANHVQYCGKIFEKLAKDGSECKEFSELAWQTLESMPSRMKLPREVIRKKLGIPISRTSRVGYVYFLWTLCWLAVATVLYRFLGRKQAIAISLFLWVIGSSMISYIMLLEQKGSKGLIGKFSRWNNFRILFIDACFSWSCGPRYRMRRRRARGRLVGPCDSSLCLKSPIWIPCKTSHGGCCVSNHRSMRT